MAQDKHKRSLVDRFRCKTSDEPEYYMSPLKTPMLNYKEYVMSIPEALVVRAIFFVLGGIVGLIFYMGQFKIDGEATFFTYVSDAIFFVAIGILANFIFVPVYVESQREKRASNLSHQFRDLLDALATSLATGSNMVMAFKSSLADLRHQYEDSDFIVHEVEEIVAAQEQSFAIDEMLRNFADRSGDDDIDSFADVFEIFARNGGNVAGVIQRIRNILTDKAAVTDEIATKLTSNKLQLNAMTCMPIMVLLMLRLTNKMMAENLATPLGVVACTVALVIIFLAYRYGTRIVSVKV